MIFILAEKKSYNGGQKQKQKQSKLVMNYELNNRGGEREYLLQLSLVLLWCRRGLNLG